MDENNLENLQSFDAPEAEQAPAAVEEAASAKKKLSGTSIVEIVLGVASVFMFGALGTAIGALVWALFAKLIGKNHPDKKWPTVLGIVFGLLAAAAFSIFAGVLIATKLR